MAPWRRESHSHSPSSSAPSLFTSLPATPTTTTTVIMNNDDRAAAEDGLLEVRRVSSMSGVETVVSDRGIFSVSSDDDVAAVLRHSKSDGYPYGNNNKGNHPTSENGHHNPHTPSPAAALRYQQKMTPTSPAHHQVDRFGFICNLDREGNVLPHTRKSQHPPTTPEQQQMAASNVAAAPTAASSKSKSSNAHHQSNDENNRAEQQQQQPPEPGGEATAVSAEDVKRNKRRIHKWNTMLKQWDRLLKRRPHLIQKRLRKGVPESMRGTVWIALCHVSQEMQTHAGLYSRLVRETAWGSLNHHHQQQKQQQNNNNHNPNSDETTTSSTTTSTTNKNFRSIQETIERDIHRTFPRHSLFYDTDESDAVAAAAEKQQQQQQQEEQQSQQDYPDSSGLCGATTELSHLILDLQKATMTTTTPSAGSPSDAPTPESIIEGVGGQAALRRVLKAYSGYDPEVGYCQGMNFIVGMFLTLMSEEEAFWMLVAVMSKPPCHMRGLFGEGMRETHQVLYVAEKLIHQFLPKLAKHLDRENIHVTMYATQWLLTQYTSSFRFDLVLRVWDCFLYEGWKMSYRVMLSLLSHVQPQMIRMSFEEILAFVRDLPDTVDGATIVEASFKIPLRTKQVTQYEKEWQQKQKQQQSQR